MKGIKNIDIEDYTNGLSKKWNANGFYVTDNNIHDILRYYPMRLNSYSIAICDSGYVKAKINGTEIFYTKNTFAAFGPSTITEIIDVSDDYRCRLIVFMKDFVIKEFGNTLIFDRYTLFKNGGTYYALFNEEETNLINTLLIDMRRKMEDTGHYFREAVIRSQLVALVNELEHIFIKKNDQSLHENNYRSIEKYVEAFNQLLIQYIDKEHQVAFYASQLHISAKYLGMITKEITGKSPKEIINEELIIKAKILLKTGRFNVTEVANILHYENLEVFCRFFKKYTGYSPLQFTKSTSASY